VGRLGAIANGMTTQDRTIFYIAASREQLGPALAWLAQITLHPTLGAEHIDRVREVMFREMGGEPGHVHRWAKAVGLGGMDLADAYAALFPNSGLDQMPIGHERTLAALTHGDLVSFYRAHYHPGNAVLVVVGDVRDASMKPLVDQQFGGWKSEGRLPTVATPPAPMAGPICVVQRGINASGVGTLWMAARVSGAASDDTIPLAVLSAYLENELLERLRVRESLAYSVSVTPHHFQDAGVLWVTTDSRPDLLDRIEVLIEAAFGDVTEGRIDVEALERAKISLAGKRSLNLETTASLGFELLSRIDPATDQPPIDFTARMRSVDVAELQALAAKTFTPANRLTAIHRPAADIDTLFAAGIALVVIALVWWMLAWRRTAAYDAELRELNALDAAEVIDSAQQVREEVDSTDQQAVQRSERTPMDQATLLERDRKRDIGAELLESIRMIKAGRIGVFHGPPGALLVRCCADSLEGDVSLDDLTVTKLYVGMPEGEGWVRVVDDSGEDYLYPEQCFEVIARAQGR
jgi:predicted Zn-dependent peptidase